MKPFTFKALGTLSAVFLMSIVSINLFGQFMGGPRNREAIELPSGEVTISVDGDVRHIKSNGIPKHEPGQFPTRGNPNAIRPLNYHFTVPAEPIVVNEITPVERQPFGGFKLSGVGSKAGGPDYLLQFLDPRVVTENIQRQGFAPIEGT